MEIDLSNPKVVILTEWANHIRSQNSEISEEEALELAKKTLPYLNCPMNDNEQVPPMRCMYCPYGHMTECHHPFTCDEAECSHYQSYHENDYFDYEDEEEF